MGIFTINAIEKLEVWTEKEQSESRDISISEVHWNLQGTLPPLLPNILSGSFSDAMIFFLLAILLTQPS